MSKPPKLPWTVFAELHDGRMSFAEKIKNDEFKILHLKDNNLEKGISKFLKAGCRIYLTGNPGDGKTHLIKQLEISGELTALEAYVEYDASARDQHELLTELKAAAEAKRPVLLAINEGPLRHLLATAPDFIDRPTLQAALDYPFAYVGAGVPATLANTLPPIPAALLLNLGERQVLTHRLMGQALDTALNQVEWADAPGRVKANEEALRQTLVQNRLYELLTVVREGGLHVTMHQLLGLLARLLTGGYTTYARAEQFARPYYETIFEERIDNSLATALVELDPARLPHAHLDTHQLWDDPAAVGTWLPGRRPSAEIPSVAPNKKTAMCWFEQIKRQFYFENQLGEQVLQVLPTDRRTFRELLEEARDAPDTARRKLLGALARFAHQTGLAGRASQRPGALATNDLYLWSGLRYDADRPPTVLVAGAKVPGKELAVQLPELLPAAYYLLVGEDYAPDHLRLAWGNPPSEQSPALRVDLDLWRDLESVRRGLPAERRPEQASRRVERFLAALAAAQPDTLASEIWVLNIATGRAELIQLEANAQAPNKFKYVLADPNA